MRTTRRRPDEADNRPLAARMADGARDSHAHLGRARAVAAPAGPGIVDALGWVAVQTGEWGALDHGAWAYAVEAGLPIPAPPGVAMAARRLRSPCGRRRSRRRCPSDLLPGDPDGAHLRAIPLLQSHEQRRRFAQLVLRPDPRVTIRSRLPLAASHRGARPLVRRRRRDQRRCLRLLGNVPAPRPPRARVRRRASDHAWRSTARVTLSAFYAHAFGQGVVRATFAGDAADYGYLEMTFRY